MTLRLSSLWPLKLARRGVAPPQIQVQRGRAGDHHGLAECDRDGQRVARVVVARLDRIVCLDRGAEGAAGDGRGNDVDDLRRDAALVLGSVADRVAGHSEARRKDLNVIQ